MHAFLLSLGIIFVAELGDKSQLMALAFATRYRAPAVLLGITVGTATVHAVSVAVGVGLGAALPTRPVTIAAGVAFLAFAVSTWRSKPDDEDEMAQLARSARSVVLATAIAFTLAELGDKTMLATVTLATKESWLGTWAGSSVGQVLADGLAIVAGQQLGARVPERAIRIGATASFVIFGALLIVESVR